MREICGKSVGVWGRTRYGGVRGQIFLQIVEFPLLRSYVFVCQSLLLCLPSLWHLNTRAFHMEETRWEGEGGGLFNTSGKERKMAVSSQKSGFFSPKKRRRPQYFKFQEEVQQLRGQGVCSVWPQVTSRSDCCCKERCLSFKLLSLWAKSEGKIKTLENVSYCKRSRPWTMSENVSNLDQGWTMWAIARKCKCVGFPSTARLSAHETGEEWRFCLGHKIVSASPHCFPRKMGL